MSLRFWPHSHNWITTGTKFNPPDDGLTRLKVDNGRTMERMVYGVSNITQKCEHCGFVRIVSTPGEVSK